MAVSPNKGYELMVTGSESDNWGNVQNALQFTYIDQNMGGITTLSLTNVNVSLTADQARNAILRLTGTLSGNVQITSACIGFYFVENLCTLGAFSITITNGVSGVVAPAGRSTFIADATNGARVASTATFPTGTSMLFVQTLAPTGWTKSVANNDKALRIVSGAASTGGSYPFSSVFTTRFIARNNLSNDTITVDIVDPGHTHATTTANLRAGNSTTGLGSGGSNTPVNPITIALTTNTTGLTGSVKLNGGVSQVAFDMGVQYVDAIIAVKD